MINDKIGINKLTALKMFYNQGFDSEGLLYLANEALATLKQPSEGYYYADDVSDSIEKQKELLF